MALLKTSGQTSFSHLTSPRHASGGCAPNPTPSGRVGWEEHACEERISIKRHPVQKKRGSVLDKLLRVSSWPKPLRPKAWTRSFTSKSGNVSFMI